MRTAGRRAGIGGWLAIGLLVFGPGGLGCNPDAPWGFRVQGAVTVRHGPDAFPLANARVVLRDAKVGGYGKKQTTADARGRFELKAGPWWGEYEICADAPGIPLACSPDTFNLAFATVVPLWRDITLVAGDALHGRSLLQDGETPCAEPLAVTLLSAGGDLVASAGSNDLGEWILGDLPPPSGETYTLQLRCASEQLQSPIVLGGAYRDGSASFDAPFANSPPDLLSLAVEDALGAVQRSVAPGTSWTVRAVVDDPDGDPLEYAWSDSAGSLVSDGSATAQWPAPASSQMVRIFVRADDGRGGVAAGTLDVRVGPVEDRFIGHVLDAETDLPLPGASVEVDGRLEVTNAEGWFGTAVAAAPFHTLKVTAPGYAPYLDRLEGGAPGIAVRLHPLVQYDVDPTQEIEIWDGARGFMVRIPPNSLEDASGAPPPGNVDVGIHTRDDRSQPSIGTRLVAGSEQPYAPVQSAAVEITDASGATYQLKPGARATVGFTAPDGGTQPGSMSLLHLDESTGLWNDVGQTVQRHARYEAAVSSFSAWSTGIVSSNWEACVHVKVKGGVKLPQILRVYAWDPPTDVTQDFLKEVVIQEHDNVITHLPENEVAVLVMRSFNDPDNVIGTAQVATGGGVTPVPAYPWSACQDVTLGVDIPAEKYTSPNYLKRFLGSQSLAIDYYQSIGALPAKDDFQKWLDANQFPAGAAASDVTFFNPNELGLTRRANCNKYVVGGVNQFACYVTKFGKLGEAPHESLWDGFTGVNAGDTVAMEYTGTASDPYDRSVKFYIYGPGPTPAAQPIKVKTAFDTDGETKYVPQVCLHCHGLWSGQFVVFDIHEYEWLGIGQSSIANIQEQVREWNSWVAIIAAAENPPGMSVADNPVHQLLDEMYGPGDVFFPGEIAHPTSAGDEIYEEITKPYCRTCHMWSSYSFELPGGFMGPGGGGPIASHICTGEMPHAMGPQLAFWSSTDPWLPGLMNLYCVTTSESPVVTITAPGDGAEVGFGGLNFATYTATVTDAEDGPGCCFIQWGSDEGVMGYGETVQYVFASDGPHTVCAHAWDSNGKDGSDCITVGSTNSSPSVVIHDPPALQTLYQGEPYTMWGEAFDTEFAYYELPCSQLDWDFTQVQDPPPTPAAAQGTCNPTFTFHDVGFHTVRLSAEDELGLTDQATVLVNVIPVPPGSPPGVTITNPVDNDAYPADEPVSLNAIVTSHGGGAIGLDWTVDWGAGPVTISNSNPDLWTPSDDVPPNCGNRNAVIQLEVSDANGSNADAVPVEIGYPPC